MHRARWRFWVVLVAGVVAAFSPDTRCAGDELYPGLEIDILPLLKARCLKCHSPLKSKGKLNLSSPRSLARGGVKWTRDCAGQAGREHALGPGLERRDAA